MMPPNCHKLHPGLAEIVALDGCTGSDIINHIKWSPILTIAPGAFIRQITGMLLPESPSGAGISVHLR